jgi:DNA-binding protein HU-beta
LAGFPQAECEKTAWKLAKTLVRDVHLAAIELDYRTQLFEGGCMAAGMTKTQLVRHIAEKVGTNNKTAATFLLTLSETAVKETKKNGVFVLPGLGRLKKVQRKARVGRNPQTGEPIKIPAKTTAKFYLAKAVKDSIAPKKA